MSNRQIEAAGLMVLALVGAAVLHRFAARQGAAIGLSPALVAIAGLAVSTGLAAGDGSPR